MMIEFLFMFGGVCLGLGIYWWIDEQIWLHRTEKKLTAKHGEDIWKLDEEAPEAFDNGNNKNKKQKQESQEAGGV